MVIDTYTNVYDLIKVEDICYPAVKTALKSVKAIVTYEVSKLTPVLTFVTS